MTQQKINIGPGTDIDVQDLLQTRMLIQANSGGGKSGIVRVMIEEICGKIPFIVIDVEGEYFTLKEKFGDVLIIGGMYGDVPLSQKAAKLLPKMIIGNRLSVIIDLSDDVDMEDRIIYVKHFLEALMDLTQEYWVNYLIFIEEAHALCGQQDKQASGPAVRRLMSAGRKKGYCGILVTQRISKLHKDAAAECNNKFIGRTFLDNDTNRSGNELGMSSKDSLVLRDLKKQHFYAFGTSIEPHHVHKVFIKDAKTKFPKAGASMEIKPQKPTDKMLAMLAKLNELPAEAAKELKDSQALRAEVQRLNAELAKKGATKPIPSAKEEGRTEAKRTDRRHIEQVATLTNQLNKTKAYVFELQNQILQHQENEKQRKKIAEKMEAVRQRVSKAVIDFYQKMTTDFNSDAWKPVWPTVKLAKTDKSKTDKKYFLEHKAQGDKHTFIPKPFDDENGQVSGGERLTLIACASYPDGLRRDQLVVFTGYKKTSRDQFIGRLKKDGYLEQNGDRVKATPEGVAVLGTDYKPLPRGAELQEYWLEELGGGERDIFQVLIEAHPHALSRDDLGTATDYKKTSRDQFIGRLMARELLTIPSRGLVRASNYLFDNP